MEGGESADGGRAEAAGRRMGARFPLFFRKIAGFSAFSLRFFVKHSIIFFR